jgi:katanin p60 ATPase-containing subunit A1
LLELQISRECALLGNYESSLLYFESVLNTMHHHGKTINDVNVKEKWLETRQSLMKEFQLIKEISQECASFKVISFCFFFKMFLNLTMVD